MTTLHIAFSRSRGWRSLGSAAIRAMPPWGSWSHCAVLRADGASVVEALAGPGVVVTPLPEFVARAAKWGVMEVPAPDFVGGLLRAESRVGRPYDWRRIAGFPLRQRSMQDAARDSCEELAIGALHAAGLRLVEDDAGLVTPTMLAMLCFAAGGTWRN